MKIDSQYSHASVELVSERASAHTNTKRRLRNFSDAAMGIYFLNENSRDYNFSHFDCINQFGFSIVCQKVIPPRV
jgi:hypothetical protein